MDKRYQVFVSSTFRDLEEERREVLQALLELGCIPSGMELFPAADDTQWDLIRGVIDSCDYYILIIGGRYGSLAAEGISYTEKEYRYAIETGKPTIAFLHGDPGKIPLDKSESSDEGKIKLQKFRTEVEKKLCKHWKNAHELGSVVSRSLIQLMNRKPAVGWVRANQLASEDATKELLQLREQIDKLQTELSRVSTAAPPGSQDLQQGADEHDIFYSFQTNSTIPQTISGVHKLTWNEIFGIIAPSMLAATSENVIAGVLASWIESSDREQLEQTHRASVWYFAIESQSLKTILIQLRALGYIDIPKQEKNKGKNETLWTLTPRGDAIMTLLRAVRRPSGVTSTVDADTDTE